MSVVAQNKVSYVTQAKLILCGGIKECIIVVLRVTIDDSLHRISKHYLSTVVNYCVLKNYYFLERRNIISKPRMSSNQQPSAAKPAKEVRILYN